MSPLLRRRVLSLGLLAPSASLARPRLVAADTLASDYRAEWTTFKNRFVLPEGRIVDTWNQGVSHSEGQGWGMMFAATAGDLTAFDLIRGWTRQFLQVRRTDSLHAWKFDPRMPPGASDRNNATDGDIYIAWGLARAAHRWGRTEDGAACRAIARDILHLTVRTTGSRALLLPGAFGFEKHGEVILNPSYYTLPGLLALNAALPDPRWNLLRTDGLALLRSVRFGRWQLPPDWLSIPRAGEGSTGAGPASPWKERPARFSYDAVRVPLHLAWDGPACAQEPALHAAATFWSSQQAEWTDLKTDALSPYGIGAGFRAVHALAAAASKNTPLQDVPLPRVREADNYYSAALILLALTAKQDAARRAAGKFPYPG